MTDLTGNTFFDGPAGRLEAILKSPDTRVDKAAIVCHPHPLFGGTMHNKVVYRIARAFQDRGFAVLRFNFRGTGKSEGEHDQGRGEQDDLRAAIEFMNGRYAEGQLWLAGFSFGAVVTLRVALGENRSRGVVAVGTPVARYDFGNLDSFTKPKLFVQGGHDELASVAELEQFVNQAPEPKQFRVIDGADHFFDGHLAELASVVSDFVARYE